MESPAILRRQRRGEARQVLHDAGEVLDEEVAEVTSEAVLHDDPKCREVVMDKDESVRTSKEMLEFNKKVNAELTPIDLLTRVREQLNLTQQQAAKVFGGGPNAFSRYESGKTKPPVALIKLFAVLNRHPDLFQEIAETGDRTRIGKASRIAASKRKRRTPARSAHA